MDLASGGSVSDLVWVADGLAKLGYDITVLNSSETGIFGNVRYLTTDSPEQCLEHLQKIGIPDFFVANGWAASIFLDHNIQAKNRIYWLHNYIDPRPYEKAVDRGHLDYIYCVSLNHLNHFWKSRHFNRFHFIYNPLNLDLIEKYGTPQKKINKIMFVGALREIKGFHHALRIYHKFYAQHPTYDLYVAGSVGLHGVTAEMGKCGVVTKEYEEKYLREYLFDEHGEARKNIHLLGALSRSDLFKEYLTTKLCIQNPSWDSQPETLGMAILEQQALGVPVVTTLRGAIDEVISDGHTGYLVKRKNDDAFIEKMEKILLNDSLQQSMSQSAKNNTLEVFGHNKIAKEWGENMELILRNKKYRYDHNYFEIVRRKVKRRIRLMIGR